MRLEGTNVSVMPREFTSAANGDVLDARDLADVEAICRDGVYVYQVREGRCIDLRIQNNNEEEFFVWWNRVETNKLGQSIKNESGVRLSVGGFHDMTIFRMRGNAINVDFSVGYNGDVLLRMRFENVADVANVEHVAAASSVAGVHGQAQQVAVLLARLKNI